MKTTILLFALLFTITAVSAQETNTTVNTDDKNKQISTSQVDNSTETLEASELIYSLQNMTCYSEISKVTFYEALIRQNNFDIELKDSEKLVLKNTEDIINNRKDRISYSD